MNNKIVPLLTLIFFAILSLILVSTKSSKLLKSEYCEGFESGYTEAWYYVLRNNPIEPTIPTCPIPEVDCSTGYSCGFNAGYSIGYKDAKDR